MAATTQAARPDSSLRDNAVARPVPFFNPTAARVSFASAKVKTTDTTTKSATAASDTSATTEPTAAQVEWRARDNRKGTIYQARVSLNTDKRQADMSSSSLSITTKRPSRK